MSHRPRAVARAAALVVGSVVISSLVAAAPAQAANNWQTVQRSAEGVGAQLCRTPVYEDRQGVRVKLVYWRGNASHASVGGSVRLYTWSDRFDGYYSDWAGMRAGQVGSTRGTRFLASEVVRVKMRVRTPSGRTPWSRPRLFNKLRYC